MLGCWGRIPGQPGVERRDRRICGSGRDSDHGRGVDPTEVIAAWEAGADFVKIFPCGQVGGAKYIKALKGPFPQVPMVPTGGVNLNTAAEFIEAGAVALGIGGELVQPDALKSNKPEIIVENARKFLAIVRQTRARMAS